MNINDLRHKRGQIQQQLTALGNTPKEQNRPMSHRENNRYAELAVEFNNLTTQITAMEQLGFPTETDLTDTVVQTSSFQAHRPPDRATRALGKTLAEVLANATAEERMEVEELAGLLRGSIKSTAVLTPSGDGGVLIPKTIQSVMERSYSQFDSVRAVSHRFGTETGEDTVFPVLSDTESAEQLAAAASTGADATVSGDTPPTALTGPTLHAYKISSKPVFIPRETITDSVLDIVTEVIAALGARIIRFENNRFTNGTGSSQAAGFLHDATPFEVSGGHLDLDAALDLAYGTPALYRPNGVYMMNDTTAKYLRKLKTGISGDKRQLWADADATKGTPATLHGYPVVINNDIASIASDGSYSGVCPLVFGDFSKFVIREAEQNQFYLRIYEVPAKDGRAVILFRRTDSKLIVPTAITKLTVGGS